jgi:hypothetical protein
MGVLIDNLIGIVVSETGAATQYILGLDAPTITSILTLVGIAAGVIYTYKKERNSSLTGYRTYEKDIQEQMSKDIAKLRAGSEKYAMLRLKILGLQGVDGDAIIKELEQEYRDIREQ